MWAAYIFAGVVLQLRSAHAHSAFTTGITVQLDSINYFILPEITAKIDNYSRNIPDGTGPVPVTVVNLNSTKPTHESVENVLESFAKTDDVFQVGFRQVVFVQHNKESSEPGHSVSQLGNSTFIWSHSHFMNSSVVPDGPYFLTTGGFLHQAYRLYPDVQGAFSETIIPSTDGSFSVLPANVPGQSLAVAVPSRLYYRPTIEKPLAGVRVGVKDIFDVRGVKTSNGNRAWYHLYPPANRTANAVQNLIDAGAVLVGKMKTSQFANGESATADWVDYHAPFNPRADGCQDPSSSSAGPAAGIAAYEWIDIALGSDTGGSIRSPSQVQGIFGNRPSHGLVSLDAAMPLAPEFDTAGLFARDPGLWTKAAQALYRSGMNLSTCYPQKVLTVGFDVDGNDQLKVTLGNFLSRFTSFLSATGMPFNLTESWAAANPDTPDLLSFINNTYEILSAKEQARLVRDPFFADYAAVNDGRLPHVNPAPRQRWALGDASSSTIEDDIKNKTRFMDWFNSEVMYRDSVSCSDSLFLYVPRTPKDTSRDTYTTGPQTPRGFSTSRISVMSGVPDIVVPVGQIAYQSFVTNHTEYLPVTVDLMAAKGCDGMLFSLVEDLVMAGIVNISQTEMGHQEPIIAKDEVPKKLTYNTWNTKTRKGEFQQFDDGPSEIQKLGHYGYEVNHAEFEKVRQWYFDTLTLTATDSLFNPQTGKNIMTFMHLDKGEQYVDHHNLFVSAGDITGCTANHCSFEVDDFDSELKGHNFLAKRGWSLVWGIGRHLLGSQIFDCWFDPDEFVMEHYTDGDLVNCNNPPQREPASPDSIAVWAPMLPLAFLTRNKEDIGKVPGPPPGAGGLPSSVSS